MINPNSPLRSLSNPASNSLHNSTGALRTVAEQNPLPTRTRSARTSALSTPTQLDNWPALINRTAFCNAVRLPAEMWEKILSFLEWDKKNEKHTEFFRGLLSVCQTIRNHCFSIACKRYTVSLPPQAFFTIQGNGIYKEALLNISEARMLIQKIGINFGIKNLQNLEFLRKLVSLHSDVFRNTIIKLAIFVNNSRFLQALVDYSKNKNSFIAKHTTSINLTKIKLLTTEHCKPIEGFITNFKFLTSLWLGHICKGASLTIPQGLTALKSLYIERLHEGANLKIPQSLMNSITPPLKRVPVGAKIIYY